MYLASQTTGKSEVSEYSNNITLHNVSPKQQDPISPKFASMSDINKCNKENISVMLKIASQPVLTSIISFRLAWNVKYYTAYFIIWTDIFFFKFLILTCLFKKISASLIFVPEVQHSKECVFCLQNIAICDYRKSVTTGQTADRQTDAGQSIILPPKTWLYFHKFLFKFTSLSQTTPLWTKWKCRTYSDVIASTITRHCDLPWVCTFSIISKRSVVILK